MSNLRTDRRPKRRGNPNLPCGRVSKYESGCRCNPCKDANNARCGRQPSTRDRWRAGGGTGRFTHGLSGYDNFDCRCRTCRAAWTAKYRAAQSATVGQAKRHYVAWTERELATACDRSRTAKEVAIALGRTLAAVKTARSQQYRPRGGSNNAD